MIQFLRENWGTILVLAVLLAAAGVAARRMYKNKRDGKPGCGCGCADCPSKGICHRDK